MARLRVLAIAVATGRVGYVFFHGKQLTDWKMSRKANRSADAARSYAEQLIAYFRPDVVVTEKVANHSRKGTHAKDITAAIGCVATRAEPLDVQVPRVQSFQNKYEEARAFAERFPALKSRIPKRPRIWQSEPYSTIYFEALALALYIIDGGARPEFD